MVKFTTKLTDDCRTCTCSVQPNLYALHDERTSARLTYAGDERTVPRENFSDEGPAQSYRDKVRKDR